jgi:hypothetical protein
MCVRLLLVESGGYFTDVDAGKWVFARYALTN